MAAVKYAGTTRKHAEDAVARLERRHPGQKWIPFEHAPGSWWVSGTIRERCAVTSAFTGERCVHEAGHDGPHRCFV